MGSEERSGLASTTRWLASGSPRRLTLLSADRHRAGLHCVLPPSMRRREARGDADEHWPTVWRGRRRRRHGTRSPTTCRTADSYVLAADTVVAVGRRILGKPAVLEEAVASLELLSGRAHRVLTGVCLITPDDRMRTRMVETRVRFKRLCARTSKPTSRRANGAARPAAMPFRASPAASFKS